MNRLMLSAAMAAMLLPAAAFAGPDGKDKGKGKHSGPAAHAAHQNYAPGAKAHHDNGLHLGQKRAAWARGQRLPTVYLAPRYYVNDYTTYRLAPPPRGTVWVRPYEDSREFYLVQAATGIVTQIFGR
jgi:Ni/Co efflux regulator RcnB